MKPGSKAWKNFMSKLYGLGAAVVIIGAMFKIEHWPGASLFLIVGLSAKPNHNYTTQHTQIRARMEELRLERTRTPAGDYTTALKGAAAEAFVPAFEALKGAGAITEKEGQAAQAALANLGTGMS